MELGLIALSVIGTLVIVELFKPDEKKKIPEEKLGDALAGYLKNTRQKGE